MRTATWVSLLIVALLGARSALAAPTMDDIRKEFDAKHYQAALQLIYQGLSAQGEAANAYDRYELYALRGECLLNLKSARYAQQAFEDAVPAANDPRRKALAVATASLIKNAPNYVYVPKTASDAAPIDIIKPESRTKAMNALYQDLRASTEPRVERARNANTLPPMQALLPDLLQMAALEMTLTGKMDQTRPLFKELGVRARELISGETKRTRIQLEQANGVLYGERISVTGDIQPRALGTDDRQQLMDIASYAKRLEDAARRGRQIAQTLGDPGTAWDSIIAEADELLDRLDVILTRGQ
jgi:hypothetical protein